MFSIPVLISLLILLILISAFFSGSETGMMSLNRYRLRHLISKGDRKAERVAQLLKRPDRLLGVILFGNTFSNILASAIATMIATHYFADLGILLVTIGLTLIILIFAETAPKTFAVLHPMHVAFFGSWTLKLLLRLFYPIVFSINIAANGFLRIFRIRVKHRGIEPLSAEELRTVVHEASGKISSTHQQMLLRILDLEQVTVEDIMIPRHEIIGIDIDDAWHIILQQLSAFEHADVPLYKNNIDSVCGMLNVHKALVAMQGPTFDQQAMLALADKVYFVPEGALIAKQLLNFQKQQKSVAMVVDEYADIQGLVSLQDILEEIVGEFSLDDEDDSRLFKKQKDGSYLVSGNIAIRELNRMTDWALSTDGPKTLSGLIIEQLEALPQVGIVTRVEGYLMEVVQVSGNTIRQVRISSEHKKGEEAV